MSNHNAQYSAFYYLKITIQNLLIYLVSMKSYTIKYVLDNNCETDINTFFCSLCHVISQHLKK